MEDSPRSPRGARPDARGADRRPAGRARRAASGPHQPPPPAAAPSQPAPGRPSDRKPFDLEELLGGRVLGWVGGIAVVVAAVFFLVMAVQQRLDRRADARRARVRRLDAAARRAASGSTSGRGQTQAALAAVAAALAALYATDTTASVVYHLVSPAVGLVLAGLIGRRGNRRSPCGGTRASSPASASSARCSRRCSSTRAAAPRASRSWSSALLAAVGVLVWRSWSWLAFIAYVVSGAAARELARRTSATSTSACRSSSLGAFWALFVVAALGYELRVPTTALRLSSASLLFLNAAATAGGGWEMLHSAGNGMGATAWVLAVAAAHVVVGIAWLRGRVSREIGLLLAAVGAALAGVGLALALDGPALVAGWTAEGVLLAAVASRTGDKRGYFGGVAFLAAATAHTLALRGAAEGARVRARLRAEGDRRARAPLSPALPPLALILRRRARGRGVHARRRRRGRGALPRLGARRRSHRRAPGHVAQTPQLALSAFWAVLGFGALVAGLVRDLKPLRLAGLALLGLAVGKVFVVDLAASSRSGASGRSSRSGCCCSQPRSRISGSAGGQGVIAALLAPMLAAVVAAVAPAQQQLGFERQLRPAGRGPVQLVPDGPMFGHARPGFPDLRIVDSRGEQVPWRPLPVPPAADARNVPVFDTGRRGALAVARIDLGRAARADRPCVAADPRRAIRLQCGCLRERRPPYVDAALDDRDLCGRRRGSRAQHDAAACRRRASGISRCVRRTSAASRVPPSPERHRDRLSWRYRHASR